MGSNLQFSLTAGFKAVEAWQQNIIRNAAGMLQPGFNTSTLQFGSLPDGGSTTGQAGNNTTAGRSGLAAPGDSLTFGESLNFKQHNIQPASNPASLAINGKGFFLLADNLRPGARLFLTRNGDFHYDATGRLVNSQGLYVVGGGGNLTNPPTPITNPGDGSVPLQQLSLGQVAVRDNLATSMYGSAIYQATANSGPIQSFASGASAVGFAQPNSIEQFGEGEMQQLTTELQLQEDQAKQTFKMFKELLDDYNKLTDDAISLVH